MVAHSYVKLRDERLVLRLTAPEGGVLDAGAAAAETRIIDDDAATAGDDVLGGGVGDDRLHGVRQTIEKIGRHFRSLGPF